MKIEENEKNLPLFSQVVDPKHFVDTFTEALHRREDKWWDSIGSWERIRLLLASRYNWTIYGRYLRRRTGL